MSKDSPYTNQDADKFAALMPNAKGSVGPAQRKSAPPEIRTRTTYTDRDLEKFQKMFSEGFAPEPELVSTPRTRIANTEASQVNDGTRYNSDDAKQFKRLAQSKPSKVKTPKTAKGGRISEKSSADVYSESDLEQFENLSKVTRKIESSVGKSKDNSNSKRTSNGGERLWRFRDLHETSLLRQPTKSLRSNESKENAAKSSRRVKLRYFE